MINCGDKGSPSFLSFFFRSIYSHCVHYDEASALWVFINTFPPARTNTQVLYYYFRMWKNCKVSVTSALGQSKTMSNRWHDADDAHIFVFLCDLIESFLLHRVVFLLRHLRHLHRASTREVYVCSDGRDILVRSACLYPLVFDHHTSHLHNYIVARV